MDLFAYSQIPNYEEIMESHGIIVPRLRGYRSMKNETPYTEEERDNIYREMRGYTYEMAICGCPSFSMNPQGHEYSYRTDYLLKYYGHKRKMPPEDIRWDLIHGRKRKNLKYLLKKQWAAIEKHIQAFDRYAGRGDVVMIHSRIGGENYLADRRRIESQPWCLEIVHDYFDDTYVNIYVKIDENWF